MTDNTLREYFNTKRTINEIKAALLPPLIQVWQTFYKASAAPDACPDLLFIDVNSGPPVLLEPDPEITSAIKLNLPPVLPAFNLVLEAHTAIFLSDEKKANTEKLKERAAIWEEQETINNIPVIIIPEERPSFINRIGQSAVPGFIVLQPFSYDFGQYIFRQVLLKPDTSFLLLFTFAQLKTALLQEPGADWLVQLLGERHKQMQTYFKTNRPGEKLEELVMNGYLQALEGHGYSVLKLRINGPLKNQQSNYLFLGIRNKQLFTEFKETLLPVSDVQEDSVPLWSVNIPYSVPSIPGLFTYLNKYSIAALQEELAKRKSDFHYKTIKEIYQIHSRKTPYVLANYLKVFSTLRGEQQVNLLNALSKPVKIVTPDAVVFYRLHR